MVHQPSSSVTLRFLDLVLDFCFGFGFGLSWGVVDFLGRPRDRGMGTIVRRPWEISRAMEGGRQELWSLSYKPQPGAKLRRELVVDGGLATTRLSDQRWV